jgi:hypothetical protein
MSQVIADIEETLLELLRADMAAINIPANQILSISPSDAVGRDVRLTIFLYSVIETPSLKNEQPQFKSTTERIYPPLALDLYFMLTCHPNGAESDLNRRSSEERHILGRVMRVLYDNGILSGSALRGELAGTTEELRISLNPITLEDLTRIWSVFPETPYRTSVSYLVTPVRVQSSRSTVTQRVISKETGYAGMVPNRQGG